MAGGNPGMASVMAGSFPSQVEVPRGGLSAAARNMSDQQDAYYQARLKQWAVDNARQFQESELNKLAPIVDQMYQSYTETGQLPMQTQMSLDMINGLSHSGAGTSLATVLNMLQNQGEQFAQGGRPTDKIKDFTYAQGTPEYMDFLREQNRGNTPAAIQIADALSDPSLSADYKQNLRYATKIERDVDNARAVASASEAGKSEADTVTKQMALFPDVMAQYRDLDTQLENVKGSISKAKDIIRNNPGFSTGYGSLLDFVPKTDANALMNILGEISSNIALNTLSKLKSLSPTGASGFGALSEGELRVIQSHLGSLQQKQKPEDLIKTLDNIEQRMSDAQNQSGESMKQDYYWLKSKRNYAPDLADRFDESVLSKKTLGQVESKGPTKYTVPDDVGANFQKHKESIQGLSDTQTRALEILKKRQQR